MSLTVTNRLSQQPTVQTQISAANNAAAATQSGTASANPQAAPTPASVADALSSGGAKLTSDLLSVLLNEQSNQSVMSSDSLVGMLDQQDQAIATGAAANFQPTEGASSTSGTSLANILDQQGQATSSATATGNVLDSLPALLAQLGG